MKRNHLILLITLDLLISISASCQTAPSFYPAPSTTPTNTSRPPSATPSNTPQPTPTLVSSVTPSIANIVRRGTPTGGSITLAGPPSYHGYDTDGNGLFEWLQVDVPINVTKAGEYFFDAYLESNDSEYWLPMNGLNIGERAQPLSHAKFNVGTHIVPVYFDGRIINAEGLNGPYTLYISIYETEGKMPSDSGTFSTQAYSPRDFQGLLIQNISLSDSGVDTDGVPGYEALRISAHFNMAAAGTVSGQAILFGGNMRLETLDLPAVQLAAGPQTLEIDFPGEMIFASRVDGPYDVRIDLRDQYFSDDGQSHTTVAYTHSQFQTPVAHFTGVTQDAGNDLNNDGFYDELNISTQVIARVAGTYKVNAIIEDSTGQSIKAVSSEVTLDGSLPQTVTLHFKGLTIRLHGVDGPYRVIVEIQDVNYVGLDGLSYETQAYPVTAFQQPGARLSGTVTDSGVDTDGDGGYNFLRFRIGVEVVKAGDYSFSAGLHDSQDGPIAVAQTNVTLAVGSRIIDLDFDGAALRAHKVDGPYKLIFLDVRQPGEFDMLDYRLEDYLTAAYPYTAFRPAGPILTDTFSDQGVDTNGNGLFENLTIKVKVSIVKAGQYDFNASLSDSTGNEIVRAVGTQYLDVGDQWVSLVFDGRYIYGQKVNGPYRMGSFTLYYNYPEQVLGESLPIYNTGFYDWHKFEPGVTISGTVSAAGKPQDNVVVYIGGVDTDNTDTSGHYILTALNTGPVTIGIDPVQEPWQIWVNGKLETVGASVTIQAVAGTQIEVNFIKAP